MSALISNWRLVLKGTTHTPKKALTLSHQCAINPIGWNSSRNKWPDLNSETDISGALFMWYKTPTASCPVSFFFVIDIRKLKVLILLELNLLLVMNSKPRLSIKRGFRWPIKKPFPRLRNRWRSAKFNFIWKLVCCYRELMASYNVVLWILTAIYIIAKEFCVAQGWKFHGKNIMQTLQAERSWPGMLQGPHNT